MADDGTALCNCMNGKSVDKVDKEMMTINGYLFRLCRVTASASMRQKNHVTLLSRNYKGDEMQEKLLN